MTYNLIVGNKYSYNTTDMPDRFVEGQFAGEGKLADDTQKLCFSMEHRTWTIASPDVVEITPITDFSTVPDDVTTDLAVLPS